MLRANPIPKRLYLLTLIAVFLFLALILRLFWVQIVWGGELRREAEQIQTRTVTLQPQRGNIYDRNHHLLVTSVPCYTVYANPVLIKDPAAVAGKIAPLLKIKAGDLIKELGDRKNFCWLKYHVSYSTGEKIRRMNLTGIGLVNSSQRAYPQGDLAAALLGFTGNDNQGLVGVEKSYNRQLTGTPGKMTFQIDATGQKLLPGSRIITPVKPGEQLVLSLDETIQFYVERELQKIVSAYQPKQALILVMNPGTGGVLAMGSTPGFDPAHWQSYPSSVWEENPATFFTYEPGSVFKLFVTAAALGSGAVQPGDYFNDPGYIKIQGRTIRDAERKDFGPVTFAKGLADSLNVVFSQVVQRVGAQNLYKYIHAFGFGAPSGIDLPGDSPGVIIPEKNVTPLNLAEMSFGQSISVTPIQLLTAACAIANGGRLIKPHVVRAVEDASGKTVHTIQPRVKRQVISPALAREITGLMERVVQEGTGQNAAVNGYSVAGKTGTAQIPGPGGYLPGKFISSFIGFAPADNPRVAVLVIVNEPHNQYYGGTVAAPVFSDLTGKILRYWDVPVEQSLPGNNAGGNVYHAASATTMPDVVGFPVSDARWWLGEHGLRCWAPGSTGVVAAQQPACGCRPKPGTVVDLKISPASRPLKLPDLTGLTIKKAGIILSELGLKIKATGSGVAIKQSPAPGAAASPGATVTVDFKAPA